MAASRRTLDAGKAVITLSLQDKVSQGLNQFQAKLSKISAGFQRVGMMGLGVASAVGAPFLAAINHAKDAQESLSRFAAVFKEQTAAATEFADTLAKTVGRSAIEIKDGLSSLQGFFVGLGFSGEKSRELSQRLQALSIDFASFNNLSDAEGLERFLAALSGSSEVLDKFGINTKVAALEQELLAMGIKKSWTQVTESEKALARLNVIYKSMSAQGAVGDAARTAGSLANQLKALQAQAKDAAVTVGTALIPSATQLVGQANEVAQRFSKWASENMALITSTATATAKLAAFSVAVTGAGMAVRAMSTAVAGLRVAMVAIGSNPVIAGIGAATAAMMALDQWVTKAYRTSEKLGKRLADLGPPRPLTAEEQKGGPFMVDNQGRPILDMTVADYYGDGMPEDKPKSQFSNGRTIGGEKGVFSNGQTIGGPNSVWDNPRPVPFANTPSLDKMQQQLANLGLNGYQQNTSDPSGRAAAAGLVKVWGVAMEAMQEKVKDVSAAADTYFSPLIEKVNGEFDAAAKFMADDRYRDSKAIATLDASHAAQMFGRGGKSREEELLGRVAKATEATERKFRNWEPGIMGGPG